MPSMSFSFEIHLSSRAGGIAPRYADAAAPIKPQTVHGSTGSPRTASIPRRSGDRLGNRPPLHPGDENAGQRRPSSSHSRAWAWWCNTSTSSRNATSGCSNSNRPIRRDRRFRHRPRDQAPGEAMADAGQRQQDQQRAQARDHERDAFGADHRANNSAVPNAAMHSTCSVDAAPERRRNRLRTACASGRGCRPRRETGAQPAARPNGIARQRVDRRQSSNTTTGTRPAPAGDEGRADAFAERQRADQCQKNTCALPSNVASPGPTIRDAAVLEPQVGGERAGRQRQPRLGRARASASSRDAASPSPVNIAPASAIRPRDTVGGLKPLRRTIRPLLPSGRRRAAGARARSGAAHRRHRGVRRPASPCPCEKYNRGRGRLRR